MKHLSRILTVILCCAPAFSVSAAPVATTSGSNLTAYNPSTAYNNQWATMSNSRYDTTNTSAKADFGNCNAVVLRCAQPKCGTGCTDASVAGPIVAGCVKSNDKCKQYGDDLIQFMTAQLVASANAKINEQNLALQQAKAQAEAQAAAAANQQSQEQIAQMQNQMAQMQQQMAQQQAESQQQLQAALAQQAAQSQAALDSMKTAATEAAIQNESGISAYEQEAIARGATAEVLERKKMTGQIQTEIENAETSLKAMQSAMQNAFKYADCDARGNNCSAPKRIKKWRELARGFLDPYDNTIDQIYDALDSARMVGVDLSQIYAMLDDSCNQWAQYMCPAKGENYFVAYGYYKKQSDSNSYEYIQDAPHICKKQDSNDTKEYYPDDSNWKACQPCAWLKSLTDGEEIYAGWMDVDKEAKENQRVVACASSALDNNKFFQRRARKKKGKGVVDIDTLITWLDQVEPDKNGNCWCGVDHNGKEFSELQKAALSKTVDNTKICVEGYMPGSKPTQCEIKQQNESCTTGNNSNDCYSNKSIKLDDDNGCSYINSTFAICDTHPYNINKDATVLNGTLDSDYTENMNEVIKLKVTVVSQQIYKQYEYMNATLRRLKTQLQKAVLTSSLEAAGAKSESSSSGSYSNDKSIYIAGAENCSNKTSTDSVYQCLQTNVSLIISSASSNRQKACKQLMSTISSAKTWNINSTKTDKCKEKDMDCSKDNIIECAQDLNAQIIQKREEKSEKKSGFMYVMPTQSK